MMDTYKTLISQAIQTTLGKGWQDTITHLVKRELNYHDVHSKGCNWCEGRIRSIVMPSKKAITIAVIIDRNGKEISVGLDHELPSLPKGSKTVDNFKLSNEQWDNLKQFVGAM